MTIENTTITLRTQATQKAARSALHKGHDKQGNEVLTSTRQKGGWMKGGNSKGTRNSPPKTAGDKTERKINASAWREDQTQVIERKDKHRDEEGEIEYPSYKHDAPHAARSCEEGSEKCALSAPPPRTWPLILYKHKKIEMVQHTHLGRGRHH